MKNIIKKILLMFATGFATLVSSICCFVLIYLIFDVFFFQYHFSEFTKNIISLIILTFSFSFCSWVISSRQWSVHSIFINISIYLGIALFLIMDSNQSLGSAFGLFNSGTNYENLDERLQLWDTDSTVFTRNIYLTSIIWLLPIIFVFYYSKKGTQYKLLNHFRNDKRDIKILSILTSIFLVIVFLMFGKSQTSKFHYILQNIIRINLVHNNYTLNLENYKNEAWRNWYINGNLDYIQSMKRGVGNSNWEGWYLSGAKENAIIWENDGCMSKTEWYDDGNTKKTEYSTKSMDLFFTCFEWYMNGNKKSSKYFYNGRRVSKSEGWYLNGAKKYEEIWDYDRIVSRIEWQEDGKIKKTEYFEKPSDLIKVEEDFPQKSH